jgi:hypothetical protein
MKIPRNYIKIVLRFKRRLVVADIEVSMASKSLGPDSSLATYPAITRQAAGLVNGIPTEVTSMLFADKILVTISQEGRLSQWVTNLLLGYTMVSNSL